ncbi:MAG: glycosyltransferase family 4 protein [Steroidobacteraceae bacterium]
MRYAYIKSGNVVEELRRFGPAPQNVAPGGPETFSGTFLQRICGSPALLVSLLRGVPTDERLNLGSVEALSFRCDNMLMEAYVAARIFMRLIAFRPQIVICVRDGWTLWAAFLACRLTRARFVHSRQRAILVPGDSWRRRLTAKIDGFVIRRAVAIVCHGPFTHQQLTSIGVLDSRIVEFDILLDDVLSEMRQASNTARIPVDGQRLRIFFLGRIEASKGVFDLFEACIPILNARADVDLVYVGGGRATSALQQTVHKAGLSSRVEFAGRIPHSQIGVRLKSATVLVAPTRHGLEGWPMVGLEGQAIGLPIIGPAAGPFPFMIRDGIDGLLFDVNSVTDLRRKIELALDDSDLRRRLSLGALATADRRAKSLRSFGEALDEVLARVSDRGNFDSPAT